jgi:pimeloyl-ACP methyl ester carboxylesterase
VWARTAGRGEDVVLLHGLGDCHVGWRKVDGGLAAAGFRVTVVDALGAGRAAKPADGDYRLEAHVARLRHVLDSRAIARAHLVGNSLGGGTALMFAARSPERVASLVLINPAAEPEGGWLADALWNHDWTADVLERVPPELVVAIGLAVSYANPLRITREDLAAHGGAAAQAGAVRAFVLQQRAVAAELEELAGFVSELRAVRAPALELWGTGDRILDESHVARLRADLADVRVVRLEGVGHAAQQEAPEQFLAHALPFLRSLSSRPCRLR